MMTVRKGAMPAYTLLQYTNSDARWPCFIMACFVSSSTSWTGAATARCRGVLPELSTVVKDAEAASRAEAALWLAHLAA